MASFFDRIRGYGAVRPNDGRWLAGVAAALARRWGVDPLLVRGGFVILAVFGGVGLLLYGLGWLFLPQPDGRIHAQEVLRGTVTAGFVGGLLCVLLDLGGSGWARDGWYPGPHPFGGGFLLVGLVALGVWWFSTGRHRGARHGWGSSGAPAEPGRHAGGSNGIGGSAPGSTASTGTTPPATAGNVEPDSSGSTGVAGPAGTGAGGSADRPGEAAGEIPPYGTPPAPPVPFSSTAPEPAWPASSGTSWPTSATNRLAPGGATTVTAPPAPARRATRPDPHRPSHALTNAFLGVALLGAAIVLLWNLAWGVGAPVGFDAAAVALGIVALGVVAAGLTGRRAGGLAPIGIGLAVVALVGSSVTGRVMWAGERTWTPGPLASGTTSYTLGVGNARLDLRQVSAPNASTGSPAEVDARVGVGNLTVTVPTGTAVRILGTTAAGNIENAAQLAPSPGAQPVPATAAHHGPSADVDLQTAPNPMIVVRAEVGLGNLTIDKADS